MVFEKRRGSFWVQAVSGSWSIQTVVRVENSGLLWARLPTAQEIFVAAAEGGQEKQKIRI
jgi:hypothetical protein